MTEHARHELETFLGRHFDRKSGANGWR